MLTMLACEHAQPDHDAQASRCREQETVMLSCRIPAALRRRLKLAAITHGVPMAEIVDRSIKRELDALEERERS